jgi:hypothetical protein
MIFSHWTATTYINLIDLWPKIKCNIFVKLSYARLFLLLKYYFLFINNNLIIYIIIKIISAESALQIFPRTKLDSVRQACQIKSIKVIVILAHCSLFNNEIFYWKIEIFCFHPISHYYIFHHICIDMSYKFEISSITINDEYIFIKQNIIFVKRNRQFFC